MRQGLATFQALTLLVVTIWIAKGVAGTGGDTTHYIMTYTAQSVAEFFICPTLAEAMVAIEAEESRGTKHGGEDAATRHGLCVGEHWHGWHGWPPPLSPFLLFSSFFFFSPVVRPTQDKGSGYAR